MLEVERREPFQVTPSRATSQRSWRMVYLVETAVVEGGRRVDHPGGPLGELDSARAATEPTPTGVQIANGAPGT